MIRVHLDFLASALQTWIAEAKATGYSREDIAAMVGHGSADTANIHHATKMAAERMVSARPRPDDIRRVRPGSKPWKRFRNSGAV